jgi:hypothetical protein
LGNSKNNCSRYQLLTKQRREEKKNIYRNWDSGGYLNKTKLKYIKKSWNVIKMEGGNWGGRRRREKKKEKKGRHIYMAREKQ